MATPLGGGNVTCNGIYNGSGHNVTVATGGVCTLLADTQVSGNVQVQQGGALDDEGAAIARDLQTNNAAWIQVDGGTIGGNLQVQGLTGTPSGSDNALCDATVNGDVSVHDNAAGAPIDIGDLYACSGGPALTIGGNLTVNNNAAAVNVNGNTAKGNIQVGQNTDGGSLTLNAAGKACQLQNDTPPIGNLSGGNTAGAGQKNTCDTSA